MDGAVGALGDYRIRISSEPNHVKGGPVRGHQRAFIGKRVYSNQNSRPTTVGINCAVVSQHKLEAAEKRLRITDRPVAIPMNRDIRPDVQLMFVGLNIGSYGRQKSITGAAKKNIARALERIDDLAMSSTIAEERCSIIQDERGIESEIEWNFKVAGDVRPAIEYYVVELA